jgi:DNA-binding HxlR family transcriptional regulator
VAAAIPRPGSPVRGSTTGRPLMAALDLLGRRWSLRILWELRDGPLGARALQARCDRMSSSVLYERLRELTQAGLLRRDDNEDYALTDLGAGLGTALEPLDAWARSWSRQIATGPPHAR